jgi:hypothetical protein
VRRGCQYLVLAGDAGATRPCGFDGDPFLRPGTPESAWFCPGHAAVPRIAELFVPATPEEAEVLDVMSS